MGVSAEVLLVDVPEKGLGNESQVGCSMSVVLYLAFYLKDGVEAGSEGGSFDIFHETGTVCHGGGKLMEGFVTNGGIEFGRHSSSGIGSSVVCKSKDE